MLKNDTVNSYRQEEALSSHSNEGKIVLPDESVTRYIHTVFQVSPRVNQGTAPAAEWLEFLRMFNEREGRYILNQQQMEAIKPFCEINHSVELTPDDFIRLVLLIRHQELNEITPQMSVSTPVTTTTNTKKLFDSRPRSSKIMSKKISSSYYEDRASTNHPDDHDYLSSSASHMLKSDPLTKTKRPEYNNDTEIVRELQKEKNLAIRQLRECEAKLDNMSKEHMDRMRQLEKKLEMVSIDAEKQKVQLSEQKSKERERLEKIQELRNILDEADAVNDSNLRKFNKKSEENEKLKEKMSSIQEAKQLVDEKAQKNETELTQARELIRILQREKSELVIQLEKGNRAAIETSNELKSQQDENTKLLEIIDRQKFDLDEARSGSRYSPANIQSNNIQPERSSSNTSLAQEVENMQQIKALKAQISERDLQIKQSAEEIKTAQQKLQETLAINTQNQNTITTLTNQFDKQHALIATIKTSLMANQPFGKAWSIFTVFTWIFFFYHFTIFTVTALYLRNSQVALRSPGWYLVQWVDDWVMTKF